MDFFDKTTKAVRDLSNATREQTELANLKIQKAAIEKKLESQYAEIGKRYVAYIADSFRTTPFDVSDILDAINPDLERIADIVEQVEQKERQFRQHSIERTEKGQLSSLRTKSASWIRRRIWTSSQIWNMKKSWKRRAKGLTISRCSKRFRCSLRWISSPEKSTRKKFEIFCSSKKESGNGSLFVVHSIIFLQSITEESK